MLTQAHFASISKYFLIRCKLKIFELYCSLLAQNYLATQKSHKIKIIFDQAYSICFNAIKMISKPKYICQIFLHTQLGLRQYAHKFCTLEFY